MTAVAQYSGLKQELVGLFQYIQRVPLEIAAIYKPTEEEYQFEKMSNQLRIFVPDFQRWRRDGALSTVS